jgi:DNA ligase-1
MDSLNIIINKLRKTKGNLNKYKELYDSINNLDKKNKSLVLKLLKYTYDKSIVYNVTSKTILKYSKNKNYNKQDFFEYDNIFDLLDDLNEHEISGHEALKSVYEYIKNNKYKDLILNIIDKDLNIDMNIKSINKALKMKLINEFKVALANSFDPDKHIINKDWFISRKLDGVRCVIIVNKELKTIQIKSRQGKHLKNVGFLKNCILKNMNLIPYSCVFDGELVYINNKKEEDFRKIMGIIQKKNYDEGNENIYYYCFDLIRYNDFFESNDDEETFNERLNNLKKLSKTFFSKCNMKMLNQYKYSKDRFIELQKDVDKYNWEGLMLRNGDFKYEGKRSNNLLKVKKFNDAEFKVIDLIFDKMKFQNQPTEMMLKAIVINDKNNTKVGSGFSRDERIDFYKNPKKILGKIVTISFFGEPYKKLRFPTLKIIHGYKREY